MLKIKNISEKNNISLDLACYLPSSDKAQDDVGNTVESSITYRQIFCAELSVNASEFFSAGQSGIKPEHLLLIDSEEYGDETSVKFDNVIYNIYRTYARSDGFLEVYCSKKAGV